MTTNVPLNEQVNYMLIDMEKTNSKKQCNDIYLNYMNLYRNEYPKANRTFTTAYSFYVSIQDYK
jgi:malate synthase